MRFHHFLEGYNIFFYFMQDSIAVRPRLVHFYTLMKAYPFFPF